MTIRRILAVVDPTAEEQPALERAAWYAKLAGATLELFICDYDQYLAGERFFDSASLEKARKSLIDNHLRRLRDRAKAREARGLEVAVDARWDRPLDEAIVRKALESRADLVVKDTHYPSALRRSIFSNTDWNLIRGCPVPLWLVKPRPMSDSPRIVAAVDPLHERDKPAALDHNIMTAAKDLREATGGELHVFHAYDIAPALAVSADSMTMPISLPIREIAESLKQQHSDAVFGLTDEYGVPRDRVHVHEGSARQLLVTVSEELDADIVVMGAIARSGLERLFLGST